MARPNYLAELRHMGGWGVFANLIDGSFSSIVAAKTFGGSPLLVSLVWATPMLAHVFSLVWGVVLRGRGKVRTFMVLAGGAIAAAAAVALIPPDWRPWNGWLFALLVGLSRIFLSGLVTVRTSIWKHNYPGSHRARIAGRIQFLSSLLMLLVSSSAALMFDQHPEYYRLVYPASALVGALSLLPLRHIRVRGERRALRRFREHLQANNGLANGSSGGELPLLTGLREASAILKRDPAFARYCTAQYFLGSSNFMVDPVLTTVVTRQLHFSYFQSSLLMDLLPTLLMLSTISLWARFFDHAGVLRFRVVNSAVWLLSVSLIAAGMLALGLGAAATTATVLLVAGRLLNGIGRGGGSIAWNLGHLHFAGPHDAELYLGIHVALTGVRGLIMPFFGTAAYALLGPASFTIAVGLSATALTLFYRLARHARPEPRPPAALVVAAEPGTP